MLRTKSILIPKEEFDGVRISVMSKHTLNDGITPHPKISLDSYDQWSQILAPPLNLIGDYYKRNLPWTEFEKRYLYYIRQANIRPEVQDLTEKSLHQTFTLLCIEDTPEYCHRRILAEECKRHQPELILSIR